jgi:hypothetical protein
MIKILVDDEELKAGQGWIWEAREAIITSGCKVPRVGFAKDGPRRSETQVRVGGEAPRNLNEREQVLVSDLRTIAEMELAHLDWIEFD